MTSETPDEPTCKNGHPRTPDNVGANGRCKPCRRAGSKKWRQANQGHVADYREANRERTAAGRAAHREANRGRLAEVDRERRQADRLSALDAYGRACACCGETIERFLTIDHVNGDGAEHRREIGKTSLYRWLRLNDYPEGFQTLCSSCNAGRHINGGECPHVAPVKEPATREKRYETRLKSLSVDAYGGKCACCGEHRLPFLCIDHVNNDGSEHRRVTGGGGAKAYRWLKREGWPEGFQVLCFNCNDAKHFNGGTCPHESR